MQEPATSDPHFDVVIVGGGAAGLSAAVALGRARRSVIVIDAGEPRNAPAAHMHNYLSRDGMSPKEFLALGRDEARRYGAHFVDGTAANASRDGDGPFVIEMTDGQIVTGRRLLVTTGLVDELPDIEGLRDRWGRDVIHCPYCHGWEVRDQRIVVISTGPMGVHQAQLFRQWSPDVTLCVHTGPHPDTLQRDELTSRSIAVIEDAVVSIVVEDDCIVGVELADSTVVPADAVVVGPRMSARSELLTALGLQSVEHPMGVGTYVPCGPMGSTDVPGVWVAGNVTEINAQVIQAAGAGTFAGAAINADLIADDTRHAVAAMHAAPATGHEHAGHEHTGHDRSGHDHTSADTVFDKAFWDERYSSAAAIWSGNPNPQLVAEIDGLAPGTALDIGAGEGADALWLAQHGWTVTAVDISTVALERAARLTSAEDADAATRITWQQTDITDWSLPTEAYDLVSSQFMHLPSVQRSPYIRNCAAAVKCGGVLLVVGHHIHDLDTTAGRPHLPDLFYGADDIALELGNGWTVITEESRPRSMNDPAGNPITINDAVLLARRHD